ncbi:hypothetical protein BFR85_004155 [Acinetobacter pittii]|uniref:hypothetical protein n=1 Tax=Acinetobacter pittii TaxID=48296 RepID=UPI00083E2181|nr:hypothetical protein [Acinetobacter pittii]MCK0912232.1 hypothetical protein [Acinetobacter pittii]
MNPLNKYEQAMASQNVRMMLKESVARLPLPIDSPTPSIGDFYASCDYFAKCKTTRVTKFDHYYGSYPQAHLTKLGKNIHEATMFALYSPIASLHTQGLIFLPPLGSIVLSKIQEHALPQINLYDPSNEPRFNNFIADIHYTAMQGNIQKQQRNWETRQKVASFNFNLWLMSVFEQRPGFLIEIYDIKEPDEMYPKSPKDSLLFEAHIKSIVKEHKCRPEVISIISKWTIMPSGQLILKIFVLVECNDSDHLFSEPNEVSGKLHTTPRNQGFVIIERVPLPEQLQPNFFHRNAPNFGNHMQRLESYLLHTDYYLRIGDMRPTMKVLYTRNDDKLPDMRKERSK